MEVYIEIGPKLFTRGKKESGSCRIVWHVGFRVGVLGQGSQGAKYPTLKVWTRE